MLRLVFNVYYFLLVSTSSCQRNFRSSVGYVSVSGVFFVLVKFSLLVFVLLTNKFVLYFLCGFSEFENSNIDVA